MSELQRPSRFEQSDEVVVMKFGGTSVEDAAAIRRLIAIVGSRSAFQRVIVVSALAGVTDQLLDAGRSAASGRLGSALAMVRAIYVRHEQLADSLVEGSANGALDRVLRGEFQALEALLHDLEASHELESGIAGSIARVWRVFLQPTGDGSSLPSGHECGVCRCAELYCHRRPTWSGQSSLERSESARARRIAAAT